MKFKPLFYSMLVCPVMAVLKGINFYGLETPAKDFVCSWQHPVDYYVDKLSELGFNSFRIPVSHQWVMEKSYHKLETFFEAVAKHPEMTVILDMHRIFSDHQAYGPTESWVTVDNFIEGWNTILHHFHGNAQLIGVDVFNEYQGNDAHYWNNVTSYIVTNIEKEFPDRFYYYVGGCNWGNNLHDINLEHLDFKDRIGYTVHKYHFSGKDENDWNYSFGPFTKKVMVGEWGFRTQHWEEKDWAYRFIQYLKQRGIRDNFFWTIAHSSDTDGLWYDDCENINWEKFEMIKSLWDENHQYRSLRNHSCIAYGKEGWSYNPCLF